MKKIINACATAIVLIICGMFIVRCCMAADRSIFSKPISDSNLMTVDISDELSKDGYFSAYAFFYDPVSGKTQLTVRWNNSVYRYTDMDTSHEFVFELRNETTGEVFPLTVIDSDSRAMYNYRLLISDKVSVGENDQLSAVMLLRDGYESIQVIKYAEQPMTDN